MKNQMKVWIHCRVSERRKKCLLDFQETILRDFADKLGLKVAGVTKEVSSGKNLDSFECKSMINCIRRKRVDIILCVTPKRICIYDDQFEEFEMFCNMNEVVVMSMEDIHFIESIVEAI